MNWLPAMILITLVSLGGVVTFVIYYWWSPLHTDVGYEPKQPIPFSHRLHAGELGIDCRYCHSSVEKSASAGVPSTETCLKCHKTIKKDSPHILKLHESYAKNEPIEWVKVHQLPDYSYFDHSRHVNSGVSCVTCHGRVDKMEVVRIAKPLSMGWCLDCHREPEKYIRPRERVTDLGWTPKYQLAQGKKLVEDYHIQPSEDCYTCHR